jgi:hypothetical protein
MEEMKGYLPFVANSLVKCSNPYNSKETEEIVNEVIGIFSESEIEKFSGAEKVILIADLTQI